MSWPTGSSSYNSTTSIARGSTTCLKRKFGRADFSDHEQPLPVLLVAKLMNDHHLSTGWPEILACAKLVNLKHGPAGNLGQGESKATLAESK